MYTVAVWCDGLTAIHKSWTLADAKGWLYAYPNKDVFAKVTDIFGRRVAVRYYR